MGNSVNDGYMKCTNDRYMNSHVFLNENNITALYNFKPLASVCNKLTSMLEGKGSNMHHAVIRKMIMKGHCECSINKGNNKITELRTILQRESQNS